MYKHRSGTSGLFIVGEMKIVLNHNIHKCILYITIYFCLEGGKIPTYPLSNYLLVPDLKYEKYTRNKTVKKRNYLPTIWLANIFWATDECKSTIHYPFSSVFS